MNTPKPSRSRHSYSYTTGEPGARIWGSADYRHPTLDAEYAAILRDETGDELRVYWRILEAA